MAEQAVMVWDLESVPDLSAAARMLIWAMHQKLKSGKHSVRAQIFKLPRAV
jgi:hypothetical protein